MAKTLLETLNETMRRVGVIAGESAAFTSLTDTARQRDIDVAVQVFNEGIDELYGLIEAPRPNVQSESTFTLVASTRSYSLASDLRVLRFPLIDKTNTQYIFEYGGGYNALLIIDPEQDDEGLPLYGAFSPVDNNLYLDRAPSSNEAGRVYTYQYDKDLALSAVGDEVPFNDKVWRSMVPVWAEMWKRDRRGSDSFDIGFFNFHLGRAASALRQTAPSTSYCPR